MDRVVRLVQKAKTRDYLRQDNKRERKKTGRLWQTTRRWLNKEKQRVDDEPVDYVGLRISSERLYNLLIVIILSKRILGIIFQANVYLFHTCYRNTETRINRESNCCGKCSMFDKSFNWLVGIEIDKMLTTYQNPTDWAQNESKIPDRQNDANGLRKRLNMTIRRHSGKYWNNLRYCRLRIDFGFPSKVSHRKLIGAPA